MVWVLETLKPSEIQEILTTSQAASQATDAAMGENYVYHLTTGTHHVGRKDASIVFNDKAVSRKHAELAVATASVEENVVSSPALSVTDLGSTFGTSVNGQKLTKSVARTVTDGDVIHFGAQWSAVRVKWLPLVFCVTRMAKKEKLSLKAAAVVLGASVVAEWGPAVTHMATSKELVFTVKTLLAVVAGVPIVSPGWAAAVAGRPNLFDPLPPTSDFALPAATLESTLAASCQLYAPPETRQRHLRQFLAVSLAPTAASGGGGGDEAEQLARAAGAQVLSAHGLSDAEFAAATAVLASPRPVPVPAGLPVPARQALASRATTTVVLLALPNAAGVSSTGGGEASAAEVRFAKLAGLGLPVTNSTAIAQALVALAPLGDEHQVPIPAAAWEDAAAARNRAATASPEASRAASPAAAAAVARAAIGAPEKAATAPSVKRKGSGDSEQEAAAPAAARGKRGRKASEDDPAGAPNALPPKAPTPLKSATPPKAAKRARRGTAGDGDGVTAAAAPPLTPVQVEAGGSPVRGDDGDNGDEQGADSKAEDDAASAPPPPPLVPRRVVCGPPLAGGWLVRGGDGPAPQARDDEHEDHSDPDGDSDRYRPVEEEVSMVVAMAPLAAAAPRGKSKGRAAAAVGGSGCGVVVNFKRFKKNRVLYGPSMCAALVSVDAEENERVQQLRREEYEAEEYERRADELFGGGGLFGGRDMPAPAARAARRR